MAKISVIFGDAAQNGCQADIIFTDPPYDLSGKNLAYILNLYDSDHLVLITSMSQLIEFLKHSEWTLAFDFVINCVVPKKSMNYRQPNYTHQTGVYLTRNGVKSVFDRRKRQRSDTFEANGYWPTIIQAPRENMRIHGMAKNESAITDLLGSFGVRNVVDPFAGIGTTGLAAFILDLDCTLIEKNKETFDILKNQMQFIGISIL